MTALWLLLLGLLGLGSRLLNRTSAALEYLSEGSYPVYILHQTVLVVLAFYVVRMEVPWGVQWLGLLAGTVAGTFLGYEGLRRVGWLRFLFGMRPRQVPAAPPPGAGKATETPAA
jgi:peptidoglycan/LPS O-acetylase OafA/YrhL